MAHRGTTARSTGIVAAAVFVGVLILSVFLGEVSSTVWIVLAVLVLGSALVALASFARYFLERRSS